MPGDHRRVVRAKKQHEARHFIGFGEPSKRDASFGARFEGLGVRVRASILDLRFRDALEGIWELVTALNRSIDERKPWALHKEGRTEELNAVLYDLCEGLRWIAILLHPVMPERTAEMWQQLGAPGKIDDDWTSSLARWGLTPPIAQTSLAAPLFPRIELEPKP